VLLAADHLEVLRDRLDADPRIGIAQGKLYRATPEEFDAGVESATVLDSAGHVIRRSRMVVDRGQGERDGPQYAREASVFSACGAALFLRRALLDDLSRAGRFFDESFFAYKEDIDLGWRARVLGWDVRYVPAAVAHHVRSLPLGGDAWRTLSLPARRHSWKNHYLMLLRNDRVADVLADLPFIVGWEALRLGHALLRDRGVLTAYREFVRAIPAALRARRELRSRRRAGTAEIRRWFGAAVVPTAGPAAAVAAEVAP
jgi:GT2 family glycosyltransferase